jgi:hypothetical protein
MWLVVAVVLLFLATAGCLLHLQVTLGGSDTSVFG